DCVIEDCLIKRIEQLWFTTQAEAQRVDERRLFISAGSQLGDPRSVGAMEAQLDRCGLPFAAAADGVSRLKRCSSDLDRPESHAVACPEATRSSLDRPGVEDRAPVKLVAAGQFALGRIE